MDSNKSITHVSCEQADILLNEYIDGELDSVTAAAVEAHLAECDDCRHSCEQLRAICDAVSDTAEAVPPALHGRIMAAVHAEARASRRRRFVSRFGAGIAALLCFGVIATAAIRHMSDVPDVDTPPDGRMAEESSASYVDQHGLSDKVIVAQPEQEQEQDRDVYDLPSSEGNDAPENDGDISWCTDDWMLTLLGDGSFVLERGGASVSGQYSIVDDLLTLNADGLMAVYSYSTVDGHAEFAHVSGERLLS